MSHLSVLIRQQSVKASVSLMLACLPIAEGVTKPHPLREGEGASSKPNIERLASELVQKPSQAKVAPPDRGSGR